jgi:pimeloyl-ACP methyl ester carboxylesterase
MAAMPDQIEPFVISVADVALDYLRDLCGYWAKRYDWRATEARLNQIPQFTTTIDGLDIHFLHVRSRHPGAVPLVMTHGWPGSFLECEQVLGPLTDPPAHGGDAADAFDVVVPSLPGYAFSGKPASTGWDIHRIARAWAELMTRLGYERFLAMGSDWGTSISTSLALQNPDRLLGIHLVPPLAPPDRARDLTGEERAALADLDQRSRTGSGYAAVQATQPQTIGYALTDSPAGLWAWTDHPGDLGQVLTAGQVLDNITLYWLTGTAASSARLYPGKHRPGHQVVHHRRQRHHHRPGRLQHLPQGGAPALSPLGPAPLCQHRALEPARSRRPLRRLGTIQPVHQRSPRRSPQLPWPAVENVYRPDRHPVVAACRSPIRPSTDHPRLRPGVAARQDVS